MAIAPWARLSTREARKITTMPSAKITYAPISGIESRTSLIALWRKENTAQPSLDARVLASLAGIRLWTAGEDLERGALPVLVDERNHRLVREMVAVAVGEVC